MRNRRSLLASILAASLCCGGCSLPPLTTVPSALGTASKTGPSTPDQASFLYVGGGKLSKYNVGSSTPLRAVTLAYFAFAIALDKLGHVFVLENYGSCGGQVQVFSARDLRLLRTIAAPVCLSGVAIDRKGYFYFTTCCQGLWVYAPGGTRLVNHMRRFPNGALAFDSSGNLYADNLFSVAIYAPTGEPGHLKLSGQIRKGVHWSDALAFGPTGDLFVVNTESCNAPCDHGPPSVTVFQPGEEKPTVRITGDLALPSSPAVDSIGRLYVANTTIAGAPPWHSWVSLFGPGGTKPLRKFARGHGDSAGLAVDASDNLYVANGRDVDVYAPGASKLLYRIGEGNYGAQVLAIASQ
jgi:hypothetical protein